MNLGKSGSTGGFHIVFTGDGIGPIYCRVQDFENKSIGR